MVLIQGQLVGTEHKSQNSATGQTDSCIQMEQKEFVSLVFVSFGWELKSRRPTSRRSLSACSEANDEQVGEARAGTGCDC